MIRNFVYLDSEKLRSLSSQLFEGVTDSVLKAEADETTAEESQKGPVGSGQVISYSVMDFLMSVHARKRWVTGSCQPATAAPAQQL